MNNLNWIWQTIIIFYGGRLILRIGGRKSISQMTITQVVVMVGIGSLLIQPVAGKDILRTLAVGLIITVLMVITEYLEMKFDLLETISTGKAKIVIEDGKLNTKNLRNLRMSVDRLETRLRQSGISSIEDVKYATIEVSGQLGYELNENKKPITKEDFNLLINEILQLKKLIGMNTNIQLNENQGNNIFNEIKTKKFEGKNEP
ncbi:DUF421 domain-containing protein [Sedimentibacter saalensis]|jgi:uncharacterized membrane protein YcaP (DUF421 family)|uniref:Uncharacterized membrane protein YcaP (DUF421 family) n=1 Tax=Sedimentibacter saalensis TaxID=130788 RepID=A0A562JBX7_9FIRM|nr:YetF domain-containing protein [Sedimentibacter saalensis]MEA5095276.1 DUF421 domain-containing protein [Sedimentibacter saalensis]TWH80766.1 uncharacterized membrane protein YcaP (DUF421 family) [Sedimentibacter saalensis]